MNVYLLIHNGFQWRLNEKKEKKLNFTNMRLNFQTNSPLGTPSISHFRSWVCELLRYRLFTISWQINLTSFTNPNKYQRPVQKLTTFSLFNGWFQGRVKHCPRMKDSCGWCSSANLPRTRYNHPIAPLPFTWVSDCLGRAPPKPRD